MKEFLTLVAFVALASSAYAADGKLFDKLPVSYVGRFQWENQAMQQVVFIWESQEMNEKGEISLSGKGVYGARQKTNIKIRAVVNPSTCKIEIWESAGDADDFVTDGSHIGKMSSDLKTIDTVWRTSSGSKGILGLIRKEGHLY